MSQALDKQLHTLIDDLNNKQKKALLGIVKAFTEEDKTYGDEWRTESYVAEMDRRFDEYKTGKAKVVSLDEVEKKARIASKAKAKKAS